MEKKIRKFGSLSLNERRMRLDDPTEEELKEEGKREERKRNHFTNSR